MATAPRVRLAPAPSGTLHVGNVRTGLYNWLHARGRGGAFVLRIEDTDVARATPEAARGVIEDLRWLGLDWDEGPEVGGAYGPYLQSERLAFHRAVARRLVDRGVAYHDYATAAELDAYRAAQREAGRPPTIKGAVRARPRPGETTPPSVRVATPESGTVTVDDLVRGEITFDWAAEGDFVVLRSDERPTYPLANTADDIAQGISLVCRGEDLLSVTPRQLLLYEALTADGLVDEALEEAGLPPRDPGWEAPRAFAHLPLIVGEDRKPLSKRHGSVAVAEFRRQGFLPEVLLNYLALLGWAPGDGRERLTVDELVEAFDLRHVGRTPAAFDRDKLAAFNGERIRELPAEDLAERLVPFLDGTYGEAVVSRPPTAAERAVLDALVPLVQERMQRLDEVARYAPPFFRDDIDLAPDAVDKVLGKPGAATALDAAAEALGGLEQWTAEGIEKGLRALPERLGMGARKVFQPVRVAATGSSVSPPLFESLAIIPRERVLDRLRKGATVAREAGGD